MQKLISLVILTILLTSLSIYTVSHIFISGNSLTHTSVINSHALVSKNSANVVSSDEWIIPDSEYLADKNLILNGTVKVVGNGTLTLENVTLLFNPQTDVSIGLEVLGNAQLILKNVTIASRESALRYYIYINTTNTVLISSSEISQVGSLYGTSDKNGFSIYNVNGLVIKNSTLHDIYTGVYIKNSKNIQIQNSEIFLGFSYGIALVNCSNVLIAQNRVYYNHEHDIYLINSTEIKLQQNNISFAFYGIYSKMNNILTLSGNNVSNCDSGIYLGISKDVNLDNNLLVDNNKYAIDINGSQGVLQQNIIYHANIYVHGSQSVLQNLTITNSNLVNNYPVYFGFNLTNETIENAIYGQIILIYSSHIALRNIQVAALELYNCENISGWNFILGHDIYTGLYIEVSKDIVLRNLNMSRAEVGINIVNSTYVSIENGNVENCSFAGVKVLESTSVILYNVCVSDSGYGILTLSSSDLKLNLIKALRNYNSIVFMYANESIINNSYVEQSIFNGKGIHILYSTAIFLINNTISNCYNDIYLWDSSDLSLANNTLRTSYSFGLVVNRCVNTTLSENQIKNSSIFVIGENQTFGTLYGFGNINVSRHSAMFLFNKSHILLTNLHLEYLLVAFCENVSIVNSTIKSIQIYSSIDISINKTMITTATTYGLYLEKSRNCVIANNTVSDKSDVGIHIVDSWNTIVFRNLIYDNNLGIYVDAHQTLIYQNAFIGNKIHAEDMGVSQWDDGLVGNYWSDAYTWAPDLEKDGISSTPYYIPGRGVSRNEDRYPLLFPLLDYDRKPPVLLSLNVTKWTSKDANGAVIQGVTISINATDTHFIRLIKIFITYLNSDDARDEVTGIARYNSASGLYILVDSSKLAETIWNSSTINITILLMDIYENKAWYHFENYQSTLATQKEGGIYNNLLFTSILIFVLLFLVIIIVALYLHKTKKPSKSLPDVILIKVHSQKGDSGRQSKNENSS